jgi:hypothetical protein
MGHTSDDVNLLRDNIDAIKKNMETLIDASIEFGLEINVQKAKYKHLAALSPECKTNT